MGRRADGRGGNVGLRPHPPELVEFAALVGSEGPVGIAGSRSHFDLGGPLPEGTPVVSAPSGIVSHDPAEMTVRVRAGTPVADVEEHLAAGGQMVPLDPQSPTSTVGGVLSVGRSGIRRLGYGHVRDLVLEITYVNSAGRLIRAGGPTVKNVSGFDLCRLLVGSLGTLGFIAEVVLRCHPLPEVSNWYRSEADPTELLVGLYRPASILWDGRTSHVLLEGLRSEVEDQARRFDLRPAEGPPDIPRRGRQSVRASQVPELQGEFIAEVGVGVVHRDVHTDPPPTEAPELHRAVKARLDPHGRLNPGREVVR